MKLSKNPSNQELAELLRSVAAALEVKGATGYRIIAYERAADSIEHATSEAKDLWDNHQLASLPGVGANIASHIDDIFRTGKSQHFEKQFEGIPEGMFLILKVPGIGPKNAYKLSLKLGLTRGHSALTKLEKSARQGEIRVIEGFGEESEKRILDGIEELKGRSNRILLHKADRFSSEIIKYLTKLPEVKAAYPLGSLRRRVSTVGDIDIAVATDKPQQVIKHFTKFPSTRRIIEAGDVSATILLADNIHVDLLVQSPVGFGSLLQHFTGSKHHNIHLREIAQKKGWSLSEKGIKLKKQKGRKTKELKSFNTEEDLYRFLGMAYIPPELREDTGEIESAQKHQLPTLIELPDIKGELHVHSDFDIEPSHDLGLSSMEEMIQQAQRLGYQYLGFR
jgi:DNA polymerase (family 10)